jgi:hypothetical protein
MVVEMVKLVAVCTRVAWFSHKSGGFLAHDLPEVLVNTDAHLDRVLQAPPCRHNCTVCNAANESRSTEMQHVSRTCYCQR